MVEQPDREMMANSVNKRDVPGMIASLKTTPRPGSMSFRDLGADREKSKRLTDVVVVSDARVKTRDDFRVRTDSNFHALGKKIRLKAEQDRKLLPSVRNESAKRALLALALLCLYPGRDLGFMKNPDPAEG
jgi:hypothetical protein